MQTTIYAGVSLNVAQQIEKIYGSDVELLRKDNGAPYLDGSDDNFSLSHKDRTIVFAISSRPVGVDIEKIVDKPSIYKIADRYFGEVVEEGDALAFYTAWTKKEAYGKLLEKGLNKEILNMDLNRPIATDQGVINFKSFEKDGYLITVATYDDQIELNVIERPLEQRQKNKNKKRS